MGLGEARRTHRVGVRGGLSSSVPAESEGVEADQRSVRQLERYPGVIVTGQV